MNFGKREQIVTGVIGALGLIAILHLLIFGPSADNFKQAKQARDEMKTKIQGLRTINDPEGKVIDDYTSKTTRFLRELEEGITILGLDQPEAFIIPKVEEIQVEVAPGQDAEQAKYQALDKIKNEKIETEKQLILEQVGKLAAAAATRGGTQLSFLTSANGWRVPTQLPPQLQTVQLWDTLSAIENAKFGLNSISDTKSVAYQRQEYFYRQAMAGLGLDMAHSQNLKRFGEFAPIIQRLCYADLILKRIADDKAKGRPIGKVRGQELNRDLLLNILDVDINYEKIEEIDENEAYFLFEELRNLNYMIEMANKHQVRDITQVTFRGYGYLREQKLPDDPDDTIPDIAKLPDDEVDDPKVVAGTTDPAAGAAGAAAGAGAVPGAVPGMLDPSMMDPSMMFDPFGGMMGGVTAVAPASKAPRDEDLGYAIPIKMTFVASNANGFGYLYGILRDKPMSELHRLVMRSTSIYNQALTVQANYASTDVEMTATIVFVPKLFKTLETVRQMIQELAAGNDASSQTATEGAAGVPPGAPGMPGMPGI